MSLPHPPRPRPRPGLGRCSIGLALLLGAFCPQASGGEPNDGPFWKHYVFFLKEGDYYRLNVWYVPAKLPKGQYIWLGGDPAVQKFKVGPNDPKWASLNDAPEELRRQVIKAVGTHTEPAKVQEKLKAEFPPIAADGIWFVKEDMAGDMLTAWNIKDSEKRTYVFDCMERLTELLKPDAGRLLRPKLPGDKEPEQATPYQFEADVRKSVLDTYLAGDKPALFTSRNPQFSGELLLVVKGVRDDKGAPVEGDNHGTDAKKKKLYQALWLPADRAEMPWKVKATFGNLPVHPLAEHDYKLLRSTALFPDDPAKLDGSTFTGFVRNADNVVPLKTALGWFINDKDEQSYRWAVSGRNLSKYAPLVDVTDKRLLRDETLRFTPVEEGLVKLTIGPAALTAEGESVPFDGKSYPATYTAKLFNKVPARFRFVTGRHGGAVYLLDEELTVRQLVAMLVQADGDLGAYWRGEAGRKADVEAKITEAVKKLSPEASDGKPNPEFDVEKAAKAVSAPKSPEDPRVGEWKAIWASIDRLTRALREPFAGADGHWESYYAAWLFHETLQDMIEPQAGASSAKKKEETNAKKEETKGPLPSARSDWLRRRAGYRVARLVPYFQDRAFAWAEHGLSKHVATTARSPALPDFAEPLDADWSDFRTYAWNLLGDAFDGADDFDMAFRRYRSFRRKLADLGTPFFSPLVNPLDDPVTLVSPRAVTGFLSTVELGETSGIRLPSAPEWGWAADGGRIDANQGGRSINDPAEGTWTGGRSRPCALEALKGARTFQDRTGDPVAPLIWNLDGNVSELVSLPGDQFAVMGASYRTDVAGTREGWELRRDLYLRVATPNFGWDFVGFRLALNAGLPEMGAVANAARADTRAFKDADEAPIGSLYRELYGIATLPESVKGDPLREKWQLEKKAVGEILGDHETWWVENLRVELWGAGGDLRGRLPASAFLDDALGVVYGPGRRPARPAPEAGDAQK